MKLIINPVVEVRADGEDLLLSLGPWNRTLRATPFLHGMLRVFERARTIDEALEEKPFLREQTRAFLEEAHRQGFLLPARDDGTWELPPLCDPPARFCNASRWVSSAPAAMVVVGVPWDRDVTGRAGARFGPAAVREGTAGIRSPLHPVTLTPMGFHDYADGTTLLEGVTLADAGDVLIQHGEPAAHARARITRVVRDIIDGGSVPVVIGGDHSITRPALEALPTDEPIHIIHLDAHTDLGDLTPATGLHHGNVMTAILDEMPHVAGLHQVGLRGLCDVRAHGVPARVRQLGIDRLRRDGLDRFLDGVPQDALCWLSMDIDVVDPAFAPSTGTPVPGGLYPHEVKDLLRRLGRARDFIGMDLVEVAESHGPSDGTGALAATCILVFLQGIFDRASEVPPQGSSAATAR